MLAEWLGLIGTVWLFTPLGAVNALGNESWHKRELASNAAAIIGTLKPPYLDRGPVSKAALRWGSVHSEFWGPFMWAERGERFVGCDRKLTPKQRLMLANVKSDPEIRRRAAEARRVSIIARDE